MATGRSRQSSPFRYLAALAPDRLRRPDPFTSRQTMVGSLKASVSQLEFENEKLRKDVGELKADNSRLDNQLVQESEANGEIAARLDDAKDLLRRQGGNAQAMGGPSRNFEDDIPPPVATPRSRGSRATGHRPPPRSPPPESVPASDDLSLKPPGGPRATSARPTGTTTTVWLPVARGLPSQVQTRQ